MDLRTEQKAERRERILATAREMIGERGYEALTMRDLARRSGVTVPTLYNLIGGKQAVLFAAVEEQTADWVAALESAGSDGGIERALSVVEANARELLRLPRYYRTLLGLLAGSEAAREMSAVTGGAVLDGFVRALEEMRAHGELGVWVDVPTLARTLGTQLGAASMAWANGELDGRRLGDASLYGVGLMLLGAATGASRDRLAETIERAQKALAKPTARASNSASRPLREVADA